MSSSAHDPELHQPFVVTGDGVGSLTAEQLRHRRFARPTRGVRLPAGVPLDQRNRLQGVLLVAQPEAVATDLSAARMWGAPLPAWVRDDDTASVAVLPEGNRQRRDGVRGRRLILPDDHVVVRDGLRVTTPARTWLDCAASVPSGYTLAIADDFVRRGLATASDLAGMVRWGRGRRGVKSARRVLPWIDSRAESPAESVVRFHLLDAGLPRPECNLDIIDDGMWLARADVAWPDFRLIVEYDGAVHLAEDQRRHDAVRRNLLQDAGWLVIVLTGRDLHRPQQAIELIRSALLLRGWRPSLSASGRLAGRNRAAPAR